MAQGLHFEKDTCMNCNKRIPFLLFLHGEFKGPIQWRPNYTTVINGPVAVVSFVDCVYEIQAHCNLFDTLDDLFDDSLWLLGRGIHAVKLKGSIS